MNNFPALNGDVVTEAHVKVCADRGHATHTVAGVDTGVCPRCGAVTENNESVFSAIYETELEIQRSKATEGFGIDPETRERAKADTKRLTARLYSAIDALSPAAAKAYGNYRLSQR